MSEPLILASASPRRRELLGSLGISFEICPADVDEHIDLPADMAVFSLSRRKADAARRLHPGRWILAADTLVSADKRILGKPSDREEACRMLRFLSGRTHQVYTGVTVISPDGRSFTEVDTSDVTFDRIGEEEIRSYVDSGEPMDKAGAYAIQGGAAKWISRLEGSPSGVIGLPLCLVRKLLREAGYIPAGNE